MIFSKTYSFFSVRTRHRDEYVDGSEIESIIFALRVRDNVKWYNARVYVRSGEVDNIRKQFLSLIYKNTRIRQDKRRYTNIL